MIITESWLREWVDPELDTAGLAECLTMAGLEVDSVEPAGPALEGVVVGRIISVLPHPHASRLQVCRVDIGKTATLEIVCGAPNARAGLVAPVALVGAVLPSGMAIEQTNIRQVTSQGMLCSAHEMGLGDDADGLLELDGAAPVGQAVHDCMDLSDHVIEIELTPNRGDCLSILGIARETAVLTGARLKRKDVPGAEDELDSIIPVSIESAKRCPRYVGRVVEQVDCAAVTPLWMRERLRRCGVRPISPVVDVTNYVMLELGQPMHAFDKDRLHERIVVRQARSKEELELLDGSTQSLTQGTLVIADGKGAIAMAGIMGGSDSAISANTRSIVLEAAFFEPGGMAGQARSYGLHTDSSHRFERGVDPRLPEVASHYATALLQSIAGGIPGPLVEAAHARYLPKRSPVTVRLDRIRRLLGMDISGSTVNAVLRRIGSKVDRQKNEWRVMPPSYRFDIERECDLIEEVARVNGYDELPIRNPRMDVVGLKATEVELAPLRLKQALVDRDYREIITYSFVDPELQQLMAPEDAGVTLENPLAPNMSIMRVSLWPGLLQSLNANLNRQHRRLRLFEIGKTFHLKRGHITEIERLGGIVSGDVWPEQWGQPSRDADFFDIKSDLEALLALTGDMDEFEFAAVVHPALHPGQAAEIRRDSLTIGKMGRLHPDHQMALELAQPVFLFELDLPALATRKMPQYRGISKFPAIRRDLAVLVDPSIPARDLLDSVKKTAGQYLTNLELFDVYQREGVDSKRKSLAFSLTLQASSRTLIDSEVESIVSRTLDELHSRFGAELRT